MNTTYDYTPSDPELDSLYAAITGRRAFSYNANADPLYRAAADRYAQNGRMAMRDTMGRAAALTGGYGSSYAQAVGQQQYDEYLRGLTAVLPEYYKLAWQRYQAEGDALQDAYGLARQRREDEYRRERDAAADAAAAEQQAYARQQDAYRQLYQLILATGYNPSDEELAAAGMTRAQADALLQKLSAGQQSRSGGGGGRSGSGKKTKKKKQPSLPFDNSGHKGVGGGGYSPFPGTTVRLN